MNWLRISCALFLIGGAVAQVPRDTSYTVESTVKKAKREYPNIGITAAESNTPISVEVTFGIEYKSLKNRSLPANIFSPKMNGNTVGVLLIHGGGWRAGLPNLMTPLSERLADAGYFIMVPEYRLSLEARYPAAVEDLEDALKWMKLNASDYGFNLEKIAIIGCSSGGQLATLLGTKNNVQAVVDIDGILAFKHPDSQEGEMAAQWLGGTYEELPQVWIEASALSHVSYKTPPTLFLASKHPRFLAGHQEYMKVLNDARILTEIKYLDDAPHSFWLLNPWFEPTVEHILKFLNKTLLQ